MLNSISSLCFKRKWFWSYSKWKIHVDHSFHHVFMHQLGESISKRGILISLSWFIQAWYSDNTRQIRPCSQTLHILSYTMWTLEKTLFKGKAWPRQSARESKREEIWRASSNQRNGEIRSLAGVFQERMEP